MRSTKNSRRVFGSAARSSSGDASWKFVVISVGRFATYRLLSR